MRRALYNRTRRRWRSEKTELKKASQNRNSIHKGLISFYGVLCISLAFTVFAWGTGYKLSLYTTDHQSSPAKLCTRGSDPAKNALDHAAGGNGVAQAPLSIAVLFSLPEEIENYSFDRLGHEAISGLSPLNRAPILYLRPPPDEGRTLG
jgi:hypothetical protein